MAPPNQGESPCRLPDSRGGALPPVLASGFAALIAEYPPARRRDWSADMAAQMSRF
jgi:hypothetical protein